MKEDHTQGKTPQAELSKMIATRWREEPAHVKKRFEMQAEERKQAHDALHPVSLFFASVC